MATDQLYQPKVDIRRGEDRFRTQGGWRRGRPGVTGEALMKKPLRRRVLRAAGWTAAAIVVLPTPASAATASMERSEKPHSISSFIVASRMARSAAGFLGLPRTGCSSIKFACSGSIGASLVVAHFRLPDAPDGAITPTVLC